MEKSDTYKTVITHTMDSTNYLRTLASNAKMEEVYGFTAYPATDIAYPATDIPVPLPSECPCCGRTMAHDLIPVMSINNIDFISDDDEDTCEVVSVYRCTSCNHLFAIWSHHRKSIHDEYSCEILTQFPYNAKVTAFSEDIQNLSSEFVEIYNQAETAEHQGLNEICGMGYRRSVEFLVDAYIRHKNPDIDINIALPLAQKIHDYISDERIKTLAKKAAWLGNDATHIEKKHPDRDVSDMKKFIKYMVTLIDADFAFEDAASIQKA